MKYAELVAQYKSSLSEVFKGTDAWKKFLDSASYTYTEIFPSQVVIYQQKPAAVAVAKLSEWDKVSGRGVQRESGIAVFDRKNPQQLTYVFDYSDTVSRDSSGKLPWTVYKEKRGILLHNILKKAGARTLDTYIKDNVATFLDKQNVQNPSVQAFLENSATYIVRKRLGMPVDEFDSSSFDYVKKCTTYPVQNTLGKLFNGVVKNCLYPIRAEALRMDMHLPLPKENHEQEIEEPSAATSPDISVSPVVPRTVQKKIKLPTSS